MLRYLIIIVLVTVSVLVSQCISQECSSLFSCAQCITRNSTCAWCNDENVFMRFTSDITGQLEPARLCGTLDELSSLNCGNIVNPVGSVLSMDSAINDELDAMAMEGGAGSSGNGDEGDAIINNVSPDMISANLRPGVRESVTITVSPPESISVDMYVLMDLSFTMSDDLSSLRVFGSQLVRLMQNLTDEFRIGFGSFVDKPVDPFVGRLDRDTPCNREGASVAAQCVPTYTFRHHLDFTPNASLFTEELNSASVSGSADAPEALFDALLQISVCEEIIQWRPVGAARRIVLALTDGDYHTALDGRLAGILNKPTTDCQLNPVTKEYDQAVELDYPSSTFMSDVLNNNRITPIFAASSSVRSLYDDLAKIIRSAFIGQLSDNSANLIDLIREQYNILSSTVIPLITNDNINELIIEAIPFDNCGVGTVSSSRPDTCTNIVFPNSVQYQLSMEALPSFCDRSDALSLHAVQVLFIGFGAVSVNISVECSCQCAANRVEDSSRCNGQGDYECSTCICDDNYIGTTCGCVTGVTSVFGCSGGNNDTSICNGRGECLCNECRCDEIPTLTDRRYQGRHCECDPFSCPSGADDNGDILPCSGHGTCGCDAQCVCDGGYIGSSCDCPERISSCRREGEDEDCSGEGQCRCGVCVCDNYSERRGQFCEECVNCRGSCSLLSDCVQCLISDNCLESMMCGNIIITHSLDDIANYTDPYFVFRNCSVVNSNCEVVYQINQNIIGTEDELYVYIDSTQRSFETWSQSPGDCEPSANALIYAIPITIVVVIIIIAIVVVAGWKGITLLAEYSEYKAWERSQQKEQWSTNTNPMFTPATTQHTNPKYRPVHIRQ